MINWLKGPQRVWHSCTRQKCGLSWIVDVPLTRTPEGADHTQNWCPFERVREIILCHAHPNFKSLGFRVLQRIKHHGKGDLVVCNWKVSVGYWACLGVGFQHFVFFESQLWSCERTATHCWWIAGTTVSEVIQSQRLWRDHITPNKKTMGSETKLSGAHVYHVCFVVHGSQSYCTPSSGHHLRSESGILLQQLTLRWEPLRFQGTQQQHNINKHDDIVVCPAPEEIWEKQQPAISNLHGARVSGAGDLLIESGRKGALANGCGEVDFSKSGIPNKSRCHGKFDEKPNKPLNFI